MAKILHFDKLFSRRELEQIEKSVEPVKLAERRPSPTATPKIKLTLRRTPEPPKAA